MAKPDKDALSDVCFAHERGRTLYGAGHRPSQERFSRSLPSAR
jgi:hypothetical protein